MFKAACIIDKGYIWERQDLSTENLFCGIFIIFFIFLSQCMPFFFFFFLTKVKEGKYPMFLLDFHYMYYI